MTDPLIVDLYEPEGTKDWCAFAAAGAPWCGAVFKLSQGVSYQSGPWYERNRQAFLEAAGPRLGIDLFRGDYHYLSLGVDGARQADYAFARLARGGGVHRGMLPLWLDVERASQPEALSRALVEDRVHRFAERWIELTGKAPVLYGGELLRSLGIRDRMGCSHSVVALYEAELHGAGESAAQFLARTGTDLAHLLAWQYAGDGRGKLAGYPTAAPGVGPCDVSVVTLPGPDKLGALRALCY